MTKNKLWLPDAILYILVLLAGTALLITNIYHLITYEPRLRQQTTTGTIIVSAVGKTPVAGQREGAYVPDIQFSYTIGNNVYQQSVIEDKYRVMAYETPPIKVILADYPVGMEIPIYYREGEPETAVFQSGIGTPFNGSRRCLVYIFWDLLLLTFVGYAAIKRNDYRIDSTASIPWLNPYQRFFTGLMNIQNTPNHDQDE